MIFYYVPFEEIDASTEVRFSKIVQCFKDKAVC